MGMGSASGCSDASTGSGRSTATVWPAFIDWLALAERPSTWTWPSLIRRWMFEREWPPRTEVRKTSRRVPVLSSGTAYVSSSRPLTPSCRALAASALVRGTAAEAAEVDEHAHGQRREDQRDELRRRERPDGAARVVAIVLDDVARNRVEQHVQPEGAARELAARFFREEQEHQDQEFGAGFVELRRMQ